MDDVKSEERTELSRRRFLGGALGATAVLPAVARRAGAQAKPTITYWNGLTGADGKVMDGLIDQFTNETGIRIEQQRILWPDLYAKLQVSVPAGEGPDLCLIHTVEVPHFASDGILDPMDAGPAGGEGLQGRGLPGGALAGRGVSGEALHGPARRAPAPLLHEREGHARRRPRRGGRQAQGARERRGARGHGEADHQGRHVRLRDRDAQPRQVHLGLPSHALAERRERLCARPQALGARRACGDRGGRVLGVVLRPAQGGAALRTRTPATRSSPASSACGWPAPGTSPACARPRWTSPWRPCRAS